MGFSWELPQQPSQVQEPWVPGQQEQRQEPVRALQREPVLSCATGAGARTAADTGAGAAKESA